MPSSPLPTLVKDALIQDTRMLYLHSCKKIFLHRDYTGGMGVKFESAYPEALRGMISENTWKCTIDHINKIFAEAEKIDCASIWETVMGCMTCYFSRLLNRTIYEKKLAELNDYLDQQNSEIYIPANVYILNPMERGLRVLEVCLLGTDPHSGTQQNGTISNHTRSS